MVKLHDNCPDRRDGESVKWNIYPRDVLPMWVADMDVRSPQAVIDALQRRVSTGVFGYPLTSNELCSAVVQRMQDRYQWRISPEDILLVPGVVSGFNLAAQAFTPPGASLMVQTPVYPPFLCAADNAQARGIQVDLVQNADGRYVIDFYAFESAIAPDTHTFIMSNPHNPVGKVFTRAELETLGGICLRHKVIVISDEIHSDLIYPGNRHIPMASLSPDLARNTITFIAPSKTFNVAGLDCAILICTDPEKRAVLEKARRGVLGHVNIMGQVAATAAYTEGQEWLDQLLLELEENRDLLFDFVVQHLPGMQMSKPEGTYLAWLDCRKLDLPQDPYHFFLEHAKVAMNDGREFGKAGEGFLRFNFGCSQRMLVDALTRMKDALEALAR